MYFLINSSTISQLKTKVRFYNFSSSISVVYIKKETEDAAPQINIEPQMKPLLVAAKGFDGTNYPKDEINIKEEPLQDDFVSKFYNKAF